MEQKLNVMKELKRKKKGIRPRRTLPNIYYYYHYFDSEKELLGVCVCVCDYLRFSRFSYGSTTQTNDFLQMD